MAHFCETVVHNLNVLRILSVGTVAVALRHMGLPYQESTDYAADAYPYQEGTYIPLLTPEASREHVLADHTNVRALVLQAIQATHLPARCPGSWEC